MFSNRSYFPNKTNRWTIEKERLQKSGQKFIDLTQTNPTHCQFTCDERKILKPLSRITNLKYMPDARGQARARQAICAYYKRRGFSVSADEIVLTAGTSEAYSFLFRILCNPQEKVYTPKPGYPLFDFLAAFDGLDAENYRLTYEREWSIDSDFFKKKDLEVPGAILFVNPNNPTGNYVTDDEMDFFQDFCAKKKIAIISDEVFWDFNVDKNFTGNSFLASSAEALTFTLGGLSKALGLPQAKLAWIIVKGPRKQKSEALRRLEIALDHYLPVNAFSQNALEDWFGMEEAIQNQIRRRIGVNYQTLLRYAAECSECQLYPVEGGWTAVLRVPEIKSEEDLAIDLLRKAGVCVYPGYFFDFDRGAHIILSLLPEETVFQEAAERIVHYLDTLILRI